MKVIKKITFTPEERKLLLERTNAFSCEDGLCDDIDCEGISCEECPLNAIDDLFRGARRDLEAVLKGAE